MAEPYLGEIRLFAGSFAPDGWALCWGQTMSIAQNDALYSLLGNRYGGDGVTTFAVPDLRGRFPMHWGQESGSGTTYALGSAVGQAAVTVTPAQIPAHSHPLRAGGSATQASAAGAYPAAWADKPYADGSAAT